MTRNFGADTIPCSGLPTFVTLDWKMMLQRENVHDGKGNMTKGQNIAPFSHLTQISHTLATLAQHCWTEPNSHFIRFSYWKCWKTPHISHINTLNRTEHQIYPVQLKLNSKSIPTKFKVYPKLSSKSITQNQQLYFCWHGYPRPWAYTPYKYPETGLVEKRATQRQQTCFCWHGHPRPC